MKANSTFTMCFKNGINSLHETGLFEKKDLALTDNNIEFDPFLIPVIIILFKLKIIS